MSSSESLTAYRHPCAQVCIHSPHLYVYMYLSTYPKHVHIQWLGTKTHCTALSFQCAGQLGATTTQVLMCRVDMCAKVSNKPTLDEDRDLDHEVLAISVEGGDMFSVLLGLQSGPLLNMGIHMRSVSAMDMHLSGSYMHPPHHNTYKRTITFEVDPHNTCVAA